MSNAQNEQWLEAAQENFQEALDDEDITLCKSIIADVHDKGFSQEARKMHHSLLNSEPL